MTAIETPLGLLTDTAPALPRQPERRRDGLERLASIEAAFDAFEIKSGQTLSFHHHYRNGDALMNAVMEVAARRGIGDLTLAASSIFPVHAPLAALARSGVIRSIVTDYMRGPVADAVAAGALAGQAVLQSHGGRARAIAAGQLKIDVAFVGVPLADEAGAATGRAGRLACGPLGYPAVDAAFAEKVVVAADEIAHALPLTDIPAQHVDAVLRFDGPGDTGGISSGTTIPATSEDARQIAALVADVVAASGEMKAGMSLQSGAGGASLAAVAAIGARMTAQGGFLSGGITGAHVDLLGQGLFREIRDVQCFDAAAVASSCTNPAHRMLTAETYASPLADATVDHLSVMLLGAMEVDAEFNVNVVRGGDGRVFGGPGGHPDAAAGAALSIVTTGLRAGGHAKIVPRVRTVTTPGRDIDVVVTPEAVAVNPARADLLDRLGAAGVPLVSIERLVEMAGDGSADPVAAEPCLVVEARDGRFLDVA